ncbi:MAG: hypothetical protein K6T94_22615 [Paenibacillus sp.]|nr:hypothetical protein [Paenibacillus sp.]
MNRPEVTFSRSNRGIKTKFDEAMKILQFSILLVEFYQKKEFNNVIALQLRMLLCDTHQGKDISLLRKIQMNPKLYPVVKSFVTLDSKGSAFIAGDLFDSSQESIPLRQWLNQIIYRINLGGKLHRLTIQDFIKFSANKSGGAHVDKTLFEKAFIVDVHAETVLSRIAKGLILSLGRDLDMINEENLKSLFEPVANP